MMTSSVSRLSLPQFSSKSSTQFKGNPLPVSFETKADTIRFGSSYDPDKDQELEGFSGGESCTVKKSITARDSAHLGPLTADQFVDVSESYISGGLSSKKSYVRCIGSKVDGRIEAEKYVTAENCEKIGSIRAKGDVTLTEVAVEGDVVSDRGNIVSKASDVKGKIHAPAGTVRVEGTENIGEVEANGHIDCDEIIANGDVISRNGHLHFTNSDSYGLLQAADSQELRINKAQVTNVQGGSIDIDDVTVKGTVNATGDRKHTLRINDAIIENEITTTTGETVISRSEINDRIKVIMKDKGILAGMGDGFDAKVEIKPDTTVNGDIIFEGPGKGLVILSRNATFNGVIIGPGEIKVVS